MEYENPKLPEGINVTNTHPLKELLILGAGAALLLAVLAFAVGQSASWLTRLVPFAKEVEWSRSIEIESASIVGVNEYLDQLTARVAEAMDLPQDMTLDVHYVDEDILNSFATLGGRVMLYRGLMARLPDENTLAMLIAHELAHVRHRDPIASVGSSVAIQMVMGILLGHADAAILGHAGVLTSLQFSRDMERTADEAAMQALGRLYGHVAGATSLFEIIHRERQMAGASEGLSFYNTHPKDAERINNIRKIAKDNRWSLQGTRTPIPAAVAEKLRY